MQFPKIDFVESQKWLQSITDLSVSNTNWLLNNQWEQSFLWKTIVSQESLTTSLLLFRRSIVLMIRRFCLLRTRATEKYY